MSASLSFAEIIRKYGPDAPPDVTVGMRVGRPSKKADLITVGVLGAMKSLAREQGKPVSTINSDILSVLNVSPRNLSRPLTVQEMIALCERLGILPERCLREALNSLSGEDHKEK